MGHFIKSLERYLLSFEACKWLLLLALLGLSIYQAIEIENYQLKDKILANCPMPKRSEKLVIQDHNGKVFCAIVSYAAVSKTFKMEK